MNESDRLAASQGQGPAEYWNPYLAGVALGATLLASFLILGAGLGASGGLARLGAFAESCVLPGHVAASDYFGAWMPNPLAYYLVFMLVGVFLGGLIAAVSAGRAGVKVERGRAYPASRRLLWALGGGILAGYAARVAAGCTSGQALSGGAMLLTGSLIFMVCAFAGGYAAAVLFRRQWHD